VLTVDGKSWPHNEDGPFCRWRDGFALYAIHGGPVPAWIVEHPERITASAIQAETNPHLRQAMLDRLAAIARSA
jgi:hypothetical protein